MDYSLFGQLGVIAALVLLVLAGICFKKPFSKWVRKLKKAEIISTIQFILIAFIVLPLLPNKTFGPYDVFNPYVIWLMVVLVSAISFASYVAIKLFGQKRGIGLSGFLGGLMSSTALALSFSGQSKKNTSVINPYVVAVVVAGSAMFFRVLIVVSFLNAALLPYLLIPLVTMGVIGALAAIFFWFHRDHTEERVVRERVFNLKSPFRLLPALKFGAFFAFILLISKIAIIYFGDRGLYLTSAISGLMDVDAIVISITGLAGKSVQMMPATIAITIAAMVNTFVKGMIFLLLGNRKVAVRIIAVFTLMLIGGGVSLLFI